MISSNGLLIHDDRDNLVKVRNLRKVLQSQRGME